MLLRRLLLLACILWPQLSWANGRAPNTTFLRINAINPQQWYLGATFGMLMSVDGGHSFQWICEQSANGPDGFEGADPVPLWVGDGHMVLATFDSVVETKDGGCSWTTLNQFAGLFPQDATLHPTDPNRWYIATVDPNTNMGSVYATTDGGTTYATLPLAVNNIGWQSVRVAPSLPTRIMAVGWNTTNFNGPYLAISHDSGATWTNQLITGGPSGISDPQLRVSPTDPNLLMVAVTDLVGSGGPTVLLKVDASTYTGAPVGTYGDGFRDVVFSADGTQAWLSTLSRVLVSTDAGSTFTPLARPTGNACVTLDGNALSICGSDITDHFALAHSSDGGTSLTPDFALAQTTGPKDCAASTPAGSTCPALWPAIRSTLPPDMLGVGSGSGSASTGAAAGGTSTKTTTDVNKSGCHCSNSPGQGAGWATAALLAGLRARRRRGVAAAT